MTTASEAVSRWSRRFVTAGLMWFVCWQMAAVAQAGRPARVTLGLYGFVFHTVFGKGYALIPTYFDRTLAVRRVPAIHLFSAVVGTATIAIGQVGLVSGPWRTVGRFFWGFGCVVFVAALAWSVRDNPLGRETGTSNARATRGTVDRIANGFVPIALGYLLVAAVLSALNGLGVGFSVVPSTAPAISHLFAVGTAALLVFTLGFRLLPRFLAVSSRTPLVVLVLSTGAIGPLLLASSFGAGRWFLVGAAFVAVALFVFAIAYADMFVRSERRRVGLYAVLAAVSFAIGVGLLGLYMAWTGRRGNVADAHARLALLGFLGLTVVGISYQFYPPAVASMPAIGDRTAFLGIALLVLGVGLESFGMLSGASSVTVVGRWIVLLGATVHTVVVLAVFWDRRDHVW